MDTFEQVWESSRNNVHSWLYPFVVWLGVGLLIVVSAVRQSTLRRTTKLAIIIGFSILATNWSSLEIQEKWAIRREWAATHPSEMSEDGAHALTVDGANMTLGPLIHGFQACGIFVAVCVFLKLGRIFVAGKHTIGKLDPVATAADMTVQIASRTD